MQAARFSPSSSANLDLSPAQKREYLSLQKEKDPELRDQALLALAGRLERSKRFSAAAQIYSELQPGAPGVSDRARVRLQALLGSGTFGAQAEAGLGQLFHGIADPAALVAMGLAGATYRFVRLAALSRLAAAPSAGLLTRGLGARTLASSLAFSAEGSVFPAAHLLAARASGSESEAAGFGGQVLSSYCVLGGLRLAAFAGGGLTRKLALGQGAGFLRQGTMLGGILLGSGLEGALGLKAEATWSSSLAQALVTLFHFNAAGAMFRGLSGSRFQAWEKGIDLQIQKLETGLPLVRGLNPNFGPRLAPAPAGEHVWRMADGGNDGKTLFPGQKLPPLTITFDENLAPKTALKGQPSFPILSPEWEVIFTLAMAGSARNKAHFIAKRSSLPKKMEKMSEAQLQTVVNHMVTQIIENLPKAGDGEKQRLMLLTTSLDVLKSLHQREGAALRSATFSALLSMLQAAPEGWLKESVRKEIRRGLRESYTSEDAAALVDHASKMMPLFVNKDPIAGDYLQLLRKNLSPLQRKVFMETLIPEARSLTEESRVKAVTAVLIDQMPDAVSLLRDGGPVPQNYFQFLRERLPSNKLRVLTLTLIEEAAKLPEKQQDTFIAEVDLNWNAMNRIDRDIILSKLRPKMENSQATKLEELYFELQWQVELRTPTKSTLRPKGREVGLEEYIINHLLESEPPPPVLLGAGPKRRFADSGPTSGIQEKPTSRPPAPDSDRAAPITSRRPSTTPGVVAHWARKFEFNPDKVGIHDMTEISGMLGNWLHDKKPPAILSKALIGVRERHPDAEIRRMAAEIIQVHELDMPIN